MLWLLASLVVLYAAICVGMLLLEPRLLFLPPQVERRVLHDMARDFGATELTVTTEDGLPLYGWRYGEGPTLVVLFSGNAATVGAWTPRYSRLAQAGYSVLHVNYRGYPGSTGSPSEEGLNSDARAVWAEALRTHSADDIVVYGKSLGGGVAAGLVAELDQRPRALILESTFTSTPDVAAETYFWLPVHLLMRNTFRTRDRADQLELPVLLLHGTADELIGPHHAQALHEALPQSTLLLLDGAGHNDDLLELPEAWTAFQDFVQP